MFKINNINNSQDFYFTKLVKKENTASCKGNEFFYLFKHFTDKIVVGSYMGMLRIFSPHANKSDEGGPADAQLLEVQLQNAIIQVEVGKFVS